MGTATVNRENLSRTINQIFKAESTSSKVSALKIWLIEVDSALKIWLIVRERFSLLTVAVPISHSWIARSVHCILYELMMWISGSAIPESRRLINLLETFIVWSNLGACIPCLMLAQRFARQRRGGLLSSPHAVYREGVSLFEIGSSEEVIGGVHESVME